MFNIHIIVGPGKAEAGGSFQSAAARRVQLAD
jgi:hypothetical protein